jgi:hypothetical protein
LVDTLLGLDPNLVTILQIGVSTLLSLAGFFVGAVALRVSYRNNFGWKPLVWAHKRWDGSNHEERWAGAEFEIWNRRTYSIVLRVVEVDFGNAAVADVALRKMPDADKWERGPNANLLGRLDQVLEGGERLKFDEVVALVTDLPGDVDARAGVEVTVTYFDPKQNKMLEVRGTTDKSSKEWRRWRERRGIGRERRG